MSLKANVAFLKIGILICIIKVYLLLQPKPECFMEMKRYCPSLLRTWNRLIYGDEVFTPVHSENLHPSDLVAVALWRYENSDSRYKSDFWLV
jgi:hypothetical protein